LARSHSWDEEKAPNNAGALVAERWLANGGKRRVEQHVRELLHRLFHRRAEHIHECAMQPSSVHAEHLAQFGDAATDLLGFEPPRDRPN